MGLKEHSIIFCLSASHFLCLLNLSAIQWFLANLMEVGGNVFTELAEYTDVPPQDERRFVLWLQRGH